MSYEDIWNKAQKEASTTKQRKPQRHEESRLQESCVTWFRLQYPKLALLLFAVPNGGKRTHRTIVRAGRVITYSPEAKQMKKEGVTAGVAAQYNYFAEVEGTPIDVATLAKNDGLSLEDFKAWFNPVFDEYAKQVQLTKDGEVIEPSELALTFAVIQFTTLRY